MTAFDAHLRPRGQLSAGGQAAALVRARPGVLLATVVAVATIVSLAFFALIAGQEVRFQAARLVDDVQASVFLRPQTSRAAAEALKGQLDGLPFIRSASLRTKESAIASLEANGLPPSNRANPLPDVWIVTLGLGRPDDTATSLSGRVTEARQSLARLPEVESVDVDADWLATLERGQVLSATVVRGALWILFPLVWLLSGCVYFLAGRGIAGTTPATGAASGTGGWAAIMVGVFVGAAALLTSVALTAAATFGAQSLGLNWKPIALRIGQMSGTSIAALALSVVVLSALMFGLAGRQR